MNYNQAEYYWSARHNDLPHELRQIGAAMELRTRIQHLRFERERLVARHKQSLAEIDAHIKTCADELIKRTEKATGEKEASE